MMIFDTFQITVVAFDGCLSSSKSVVLKKKESKCLLKCNSTVYGCAYMYSIEYVFLDYAVH